jgi:hypothetical protein
MYDPNESPEWFKVKVCKRIYFDVEVEALGIEEAKKEAEKLAHFLDEEEGKFADIEAVDWEVFNKKARDYAEATYEGF